MNFREQRDTYQHVTQLFQINATLLEDNVLRTKKTGGKPPVKLVGDEARNRTRRIAAYGIPWLTVCLRERANPGA